MFLCSYPPNTFVQWWWWTPDGKSRFPFKRWNYNVSRSRRTVVKRRSHFKQCTPQFSVSIFPAQTIFIYVSHRSIFISLIRIPWAIRDFVWCPFLSSSLPSVIASCRCSSIYLYTFYRIPLPIRYSFTCFFYTLTVAR